MVVEAGGRSDVILIVEEPEGCWCRLGCSVTGGFKRKAGGGGLGLDGSERRGKTMMGKLIMENKSFS